MRWILLFLLGTTLHAANNQRRLKQEPPMKQPEMNDPLRASRFDAENGYGVSFTGEFLWWLPSVDNVQYALKGTGLPIITNRPQELDFHYSPGFRLDAGFHSDERGFLIEASWTRFHPSATRASVADLGSGDTLLSFLGSVLEAASGYRITTPANESWELKYDLGDIFLESPSFAYRSFAFQPFLGIRGGRIDQPINCSSTGTFGGAAATDTIELDQKFWCAGISGGTNISWNMGWGFQFFGDFLASLVFGHFKLNETYEATLTATGQTFTGIFKDHFARFRPNFQAMMGFLWGRSFDNRWNLSLSAAYEIAFWPSFNQLLIGRHDEGDTQGVILKPTRLTGDLGMGGLTFSAGVTF